MFFQFLKSFDTPHLRRTIAVASAVGGGIEIPGIAELPDGRVGEIAWDEGIACARGVPLGRMTLYRQRQ